MNPRRLPASTHTSNPGLSYDLPCQSNMDATMPACKDTCTVETQLTNLPTDVQLFIAWKFNAKNWRYIIYILDNNCFHFMSWHGENNNITRKQDDTITANRSLIYAHYVAYVLRCVWPSTVQGTNQRRGGGDGHSWVMLQPRVRGGVSYDHPLFLAFCRLKIDFCCCLFISWSLVVNHLNILLRCANITVNCIFLLSPAGIDTTIVVDRFPVGTRNISLQRSLQTNSESHLVFYPRGTWVF
jgi:hypothetical protein